MIFLVAIGVSLALLGGFLLLTMYEGRKQTRVLGGARSAFDARIAKISFIASHVNWSEFLGEFVRTGASNVIHMLAEGTLAAVRALERLLTRIVRYLRGRRDKGAEAAPVLPSTKKLLGMLERTTGRFRKKDDRDTN